MVAPSEGRRELKKRATRAKLIDAAANLVGEQGYDNTTVQQIADAVEVSPRTVAHYFPSKDGLLLAQVHDLAESVSYELSRVPAEQSPFEALLTANIALLDRFSAQLIPTGAQRLGMLLRSMHVSPAVQPMSTAARTPALSKQMALRMGVEPDDRTLELVFSVWASLTGIAWSGVTEMYTAGEVDAAGLPTLLRDRLLEAYHQLVELSD